MFWKSSCLPADLTMRFHALSLLLILCCVCLAATQGKAWKQLQSSEASGISQCNKEKTIKPGLVGGFMVVWMLGTSCSVLVSVTNGFDCFEFVDAVWLTACSCSVLRWLLSEVCQKTEPRHSKTRHSLQDPEGRWRLQHLCPRVSVQTPPCPFPQTPNSSLIWFDLIWNVLF